MSPREPGAPERWVAIDGTGSYCSCAKGRPALVIVPDCGHFGTAAEQFVRANAALLMAAERLEAEAAQMSEDRDSMWPPSYAMAYERAARFLRTLTDSETL